MFLCSPFSPTLITLLFSPFTDNFLFIHTLLNTVTNLCKFSFDSPNRTVSSANNNTFTLHKPPPLILSKPKSSSPHSLLTSLITLSMYRLNNQWDITHPASIPLSLQIFHHLHHPHAHTICYQNKILSLHQVTFLL